MDPPIPEANAPWSSLPTPAERREPTQTVPQPDRAQPNWWVFVVFGIVSICVAVAVFSYTSRCPCETTKTKSVSFVEPVQASPQTDVKPFVQDSHPQTKTPPPQSASLKSTSFVLSWVGGTVGPAEGQRVHFLLNEKPYTTFSCSAKSIFATHERVRVTLPKGSYVVRVVFGDATQAVSYDVPSGGLVTLTETTLAAVVPSDPLAVPEAEVGVCSRDAASR